MARRDILPGFKCVKELPGLGGVQKKRRGKMTVGLKMDSPIWERMEKQLFSGMKKR